MSLTDQAIENAEQKFQVLTSSKDEIEELASELADNYIDYFTVDISEQQQNLEDSIEECLTHLEEVCSVFDNYRHSASQIPDFVKEISSKQKSLEKLFDQVDAVEQYIFETNRLLDQLDSLMKDLESHKRSSGNKIRQIMDLIPRISLAGMPRLGLLNSLGGLMEEHRPTILDESVDSEPSTASIGEILTLIANIEASIIRTTASLDQRLDGFTNIEENPHPGSSSEQDYALPTDDNQVDGSWQELL